MVTTIAALRKKTILTLANGGIESPEFEALVLLEHVLSYTQTQQIIRGGEVVPQDKIDRLNTAIEKRLTHYPLQYIVGKWEFMGLPFFLNKDTLIPRADTEQLVETVLNRFSSTPHLKVLDLCCGSGCIGISLAKFLNLPKVDLCDINQNAVEMTIVNIKENQAQPQCNAFIHDVLQPFPYDTCYDIITANPPYIPQGALASLQAEVLFEPMLALDGGEDGLLFYRSITKKFKKHLTPKGWLFFECGIHQHKEIETLLEETGYHHITTVNDLNGIGRVVIGQN